MRANVCCRLLSRDTAFGGGWGGLYRALSSKAPTGVHDTSLTSLHVVRFGRSFYELEKSRRGHLGLGTSYGISNW